jgi:ribonuclease Z
MRVIACGTGMPTTRAAACFLVELCNGDKFFFDMGSGAAERISSLQIPSNYLDKVFIGHLHTDHFGSLHDLFTGGALMGRNVPLRVWGSSGPTEELGTAFDGRHHDGSGYRQYQLPTSQDRWLTPVPGWRAR